MKKLVVLILAAMLSGCGVMSKLTSAKPKFPDPYIDEKTKTVAKCEELMAIKPDQRDLQNVFEIVVKNYVLHYQCSNHVEGWNEWYKKQKEIYDKVK